MKAVVLATSLVVGLFLVVLPQLSQRSPGAFSLPGRQVRIMPACLKSGFTITATGPL